MTETEKLPFWLKYTLTLKEASAYFGISYKKLRILCKENRDAEYIVWSGNRALIKRKLFEEFINESLNVI